MAVWEVIYHEQFEEEMQGFPEPVQDKILERVKVLKEEGPNLPRPYVDKLQASTHNNMKELRVPVGRNAWRVAFAFDPDRRAILLVGAMKAGSVGRFYKRLAAKADKRYREHLEGMR